MKANPRSAGTARQRPPGAAGREASHLLTAGRQATIGIGLLLSGVFVVSFGLFYRQRQAEIAGSYASDISADSTARPAPLPTGSVPAPLHPPAASPPAIRPTTPVPPVAGAAPSEPGEQGDPGQPTKTLPVAFHIWNRRDLSKIDGNVRNTSSGPLSITLRATNAATQSVSEMQMMLAPGEVKAFDTDHGLALASGDQLVLHCPPFEDKVQRVP